MYYYPILKKKNQPVKLTENFDLIFEISLCLIICLIFFAVIQSLDGITLASLLEFMYTGQIRVTNENVQELLIAGDMIELREVVEICTDHLVCQLEPSNALGIFRFASDHNCLLLKEAALR